jgi:hypothetical protein
LPKMPQAQPELKKVSTLFKLWCAFCPGTPADNALFLQYMEKRVFCQLNGNRKVIGILRGYDVRRIPSVHILSYRGDAFSTPRHETRPWDFGGPQVSSGQMS